MKLAVTGAAGLIGVNVVRAGVARGHEVAAIVRPGGQRDLLTDLDARIVEADMLGSPDAIAAACEGADAIVHTAAIFAYGGDAEAVHRIAIEGTANILEAARLAGVGRVVVTSSSVVLGYSDDGSVIDESAGLADPAGQPAYVAAKIAQDAGALEVADALGIELVLACPTMSLGPTGSALGPSNGIVLAYLNDRTRSSFQGGCNIVSAEDVGAGHVILAERGEAGEHYLLGSENMLWRDIHALIGELAGVGGPHMELGRALSQLAAAYEEGKALLTGAPALTTREQADMVGRYYWYSSAKAEALGYAPRPAIDALEETLSWLASSRHVGREARAAMRLSDRIWQRRFAEDAA